MTRQVIARLALSFDATEGVERAAPGSAPVAFRIWRAGPNETDMGVHVFSETSAELLMGEQEKRGNLYSIDADHMSLDAKAPPESRKAVGWHRLAVRQSATGPELWAVDVEWTDAVRAGLEKQPPEWRYFSPAYHVDAKTGEIDRYLNTAITNNPATWNVTALARQRLIAATAGKVRMNYQDIAAALFGSDDEKKKEARKCIAEMNEHERKAFEAVKRAAFAEDDPEKEGGDEETKRAAEAEEEEKKKKDEEAKRQAASLAAAASDTAKTVELAKKVDELSAQLAARDARDKAADEARQREAIFAKRPDIGPTVRATLEGLPVEQVSKIVAAMPRVVASTTSSSNAVLAGGGVSGGESQGQHNATIGRLSANERTMLASVHALDGPVSADVVRATRKGCVLEMPMHTPTPTQITARIKELEAELAAHRAEIAA